MRTIMLGLLAATTLVGGCAEGTYNRPESNYQRYSQYDYDRPDPQYSGYYADHYYREDSRRYQEHQLSANDRVYRGQDGRYYCRHSDGTTGLVVGAAVGGLFGNLIAPGGSKVLGTVLGAGAGAVAGSAVDSNSDVRCR